MTAPRFCEACGRKASPGARFCGGCGAALPAVEPPADEPALPPPEPGAAPPRPPEEELFSLRPLAVQGFGELLLALLTLGVFWLVLWLRRVWTLYRITSQRIEVRTGVLDRRRETIELFRIQDFEIQEPLFLRLRGAGNIVVRSMDAAEGEMTLRAVPGVQEVYETLRSTAIDERERHRVRLLEGMG